MLVEKENILFEKWSKRRPGFVADGIVDEQQYLDSGIKLLFVLKEVNDQNGGGWDLRNFLREGAREQTWNNITRWVQGIRELNRDINWSDLETIDEGKRRSILKTICAINIKKSPGTYVADNDELKKIAEEDKLFLNEQFSLYDPDLVICCGSVTSGIFHSLIEFDKKPDWQCTSRGIRFHQYKTNKYVVEFVHPEARVTPCLLYYGLIDAVRTLFQKSV